MNHLHIAHLSTKQKRKTVDTLAYAVGVGGNVAVIPQIIKAWTDKAPGMAIMTWILFMVFGLVWLLYALLHRQKPLIVAQLVGLTCNAAVVAGWFVNNYLR